VRLFLNVCTVAHVVIILSLSFPDEITIMDLVDKGLTNKEVASKAGIPIEMVSKMLNGMFSKASVKSKTELVKWWRNQTETVAM
jgi:DNA-binding NarL/FixJ family response regulator